MSRNCLQTPADCFLIDAEVPGGGVCSRMFDESLPFCDACPCYPDGQEEVPLLAQQNEGCPYLVRLSGPEEICIRPEGAISCAACPNP